HHRHWADVPAGDDLGYLAATALDQRHTGLAELLLAEDVGGGGQRRVRQDARVDGLCGVLGGDGHGVPAPGALGATGRMPWSLGALDRTRARLVLPNGGRRRPCGHRLWAPGVGTSV